MLHGLTQVKEPRRNRRYTAAIQTTPEVFTVKKVAYIITRNGTRELIEGCLLGTIANGCHGAQTVAMHFVEDGVYHLIKGTSTGDRVEKAIREHGVTVLACECSVENRGIEDQLVDGVQIGHLSHLWEAAETADHVIAI
jgi:intracellular sulfur oxidation DsrE/DsrF family protein